MSKSDSYINVDWDYLGWSGRSDSFSFSQKDWNQTLITRINQVSAHIYQISQRGLANSIKMHPMVLTIVQTLEYYKNVNEKHSISDRYKITLDESLPIDKIYVSYENYPMDALVHDSSDIGGDNIYVTIHSESPSLNEYKEKALLNDKIQLKIIEPNMLIGEISILNHQKISVNPSTGEITITPASRLVEIGQEYFIPTQPRTQEDINEIIENSRHLVTPEKMPKQTEKSLLDESMVMIHNINDEQKRVFTIPVGEPMNEEQARTFVQKIKNLFKKGKYE